MLRLDIHKSQEVVILDKTRAITVIIVKIYFKPLKFIQNAHLTNKCIGDWEIQSVGQSQIYWYPHIYVINIGRHEKIGCDLSELFFLNRL